jgi:hypothetical protein
LKTRILGWNFLLNFLVSIVEFKMTLPRFIALQWKLSYRPLHASPSAVESVLRRGINGHTKPGPLPLADRQQQKEVDQLIRSVQGAIENGALPHPDVEKEPLPRFSEDINPSTGEKGGPKGPEPTRYGDWERKGRVYGMFYNELG